MILVVSAPSGTGKTTVLGRVLAKVAGLRFSVSHTTRAPRTEEREGHDYHFISRAGFEELVQAGRFLEWANVHGELYGTSLDEYDAALRDGVDLLLDVDVQGAAQVRARVCEAVSVFLLPPSRVALEARLRGRGGLAAATIEKRLLGARAEVARLHEYDYALVNEDVDVCALAVESILGAGRLRTVLQDEAVAAAAHSFEE